MRTPTSLRVATANAASGRDKRAGQPDLPAWATAAAGLDVDVLAVQEVDYLLERSGRVDQAAEIATACAGDGPPWTARFAAAVHGTPANERTMRSATSTRDGEPSYGVALLTRHPVRQWHELRMDAAGVRVPVPFPDDGRPFFWVPDEQRVALAGLVETPGGDVTVVCTHLSFAPRRAAGQLRELVTWARALPRPLLLLGDLNLPGRLPANITGWSPLAQGATYPARLPLVQLDHVLLDAGDATVRVGDTSVRVVAHSDHRALRAELTLA